MLIDNPEVFRVWLTTVLEPLCDADPETLAKYVYALVKKEKPLAELKKSTALQLEAFLHGETESFIALLFKTIENKEYLNAKKDIKPKDEKKKTEKSDDEAKVTSLVVPAATSVEPVTGDLETKVDEVVNEEVKVNEEVISTTVDKVNGEKQIQSSVVSEGTVKTSEEKVAERKKEGERDERFRLNRSRIRIDNNVARGPRSRSRSWERGRRSRSRERDRDRQRERDRTRLYRNKSPPRRYDRRRSYSRSPSPGRYRGPSRSPSKSPKLRGRFRNRSPPGSHSRSRSRSNERKKLGSGRGDDTPTQDSGHGDVDMRSLASVMRDQTHVSGSRRCRDFDEKGFCMRGDLCPYDHGTDPVVLEDLSLPVLQYGPNSQPPRGPLHEAMHPMGPVPGLPPPTVGPMPIRPPPHHMMQGPPPPLMLRPPPTMEYNPDAPGMNPGAMWGRPQFPVRGMPRMMHPPPGMVGFMGHSQRELISVPVEGHHNYHVNAHMVDMGRPRRGHPMNSLKPGFDGKAANCCLMIKKVPPGLNNITHLNNHFAKFGKIVNIQVNLDNDPESALVTFSSPAEANAAIKSTEAVLNNRFIKVFWHNEGKVDPGKIGNTAVKERLGPQVTSTPTTTSAPLASTTPTQTTSMPTTTITSSTSQRNTCVSSDPLKKDNVTFEDRKAKTLASIRKAQEIVEKNKLLRKRTEEKRKEAVKLTNDLRRRSQNLMEKQIEEQKELIKKLETGNLDAKQKANIKTAIQLMQEGIERIKKDLLVTAKPVKKIVPVKKTKEEIEKEILDTELDLMTKQQEGGDVTQLQRKVTLLKIELLRQQQQQLPRPVPRPRVLKPHSLMSVNRTLNKKTVGGAKAVDHRPTKLLVSGYESDEKDQVLTHFRQFGEIGDYISDDSTPSVVLNFKTRQEAEVAMVKGKNFQDRLLTVTWFTNSNFQTKRRKSSVNGPTYHMHAGRQVLLSGSETDLDTENNPDNDESELEFGLDTGEDILLQDDDDDAEDEERSWRR